jgi:hypothetical protein
MKVGTAALHKEVLGQFPQSSPMPENLRMGTLEHPKSPEDNAPCKDPHLLLDFRLPLRLQDGPRSRGHLDWI